MQKIERTVEKAQVGAPNEILLVLEAVTGQNGLSQAKHFTNAVGIDGIILTKLDGTAKGGIAFAIAHELKIPIKYIGTGEKVVDFAEFEPEAYVNALFQRA
jgi:fused signal recognition particle receptor